MTGNPWSDWLLTGLAIGAVLFLVFFLILRWFWLWYWRIDAILARLTEIRDELRRLNGTIGHPAIRAAPQDAPDLTPPLPPEPRTLPPSPQARSRSGP